MAKTAQTSPTQASPAQTSNVTPKPAAGSVVARLDAVVDDFARRTRLFNEPMTPGRAKMFVFQHRQNTRQRNSVLKLRVATNCPDWDIKLRIIGACSEEIIADHEHGHGKPHWLILEELGTKIGLSTEQIRSAPLLVSTQMSWLAWEALMSNRHWLEGLIGNTCAERVNVPGYGTGLFKDKGWFYVERKRWGDLFKLPNEDLDFFELHEAADIAHSNLGWQTIAERAEKLGMVDQVVHACRLNLFVWENYLNGIADGGDALDRGETPRYV